MIGWRRSVWARNVERRCAGTANVNGASRNVDGAVGASPVVGRRGGVAKLLRGHTLVGVVVSCCWQGGGDGGGRRWLELSRGFV